MRFQDPQSGNADRKASSSAGPSGGQSPRVCVAGLSINDDSEDHRLTRPKSLDDMLYRFQHQSLDGVYGPPCRRRKPSWHYDAQVDQDPRGSDYRREIEKGRRMGLFRAGRDFKPASHVHKWTLQERQRMQEFEALKREIEALQLKMGDTDRLKNDNGH